MRRFAWKHRNAARWPNGSTAIETTATVSKPSYVGRFAPSPTGPLHMGSLVAAVGSWLDARANDGQWLLRVEDLDPPREEPGAADSFLHDLDKLGLDWDGPVTYQSHRLVLYEDALQTLLRDGLAYRCGCSRRDIERVWQDFPENPQIYPGTCRSLASPAADQDPASPVACRLNVSACPAPAAIEFDDRISGLQRQDVAAETGDFVLKRRDGLHAYQLAVVVDDHLQGITDIVRGEDLLDNTARQIVLQRALSFSTPRYAHLPMVFDAGGQKLGKRSGASRIDADQPGIALLEAFAHLGLNPPGELTGEAPQEVLRWARDRWDSTGPQVHKKHAR